MTVISHVAPTLMTQSPMISQSFRKPVQTEAGMRKTAEDFEAMALGEMLEPVFETVDTSKGPFGGGEAEEQFRSLQVLELGKQIARNGGIGIAKQVYKSMQRMQEQANSQLMKKTP